jgi:hypothetical protein
LLFDTFVPILAGRDVLIGPDIEAVAQGRREFVLEALEPGYILARIADEDTMANGGCRWKRSPQGGYGRKRCCHEAPSGWIAVNGYGRCESDAM